MGFRLSGRDGYSVVAHAERPASLGFAGIAGLRRLALSGVSTMALGLGLAAAGGAAPALADPLPAGTIVLSGSQTISTDFSDIVTTGGTGSGGGAGLGGALFIGDGATVTLNSVDFIGNTVVGGTGGVGSTGGSLNGITGTVTGSTGVNGRDASENSAYYAGNGYGGGGQNGFDGGSGVNGIGGTGGMGGNGGDAASVTAASVKAALELAYAAYTAGSDTTAGGLYTSIAAAFSGMAITAATGVPPVGDNATLVAAYTTLATEFGSLAADAGGDVTQDLAKVAYETAWLAAIDTLGFTNGVSGGGGSGGSGGSGGAGSFGFGGGVGGAGGDGGNAVDAVLAEGAAAGGSGGGGGSGGAGGFGAGGGRGGNGGTAGDDASNALNQPADGSGGSGGSAGFGGGIGSTADGTTDGTGGGGGSGYGGAIFVQSGGTLNITGNTLFDGNMAFGGSSENGGDAGQAAGTDLFMMKGSTVNLNAGTGNTITFNGTIADDSLASISGTAIASGKGAGINIISGLVIFNGENTYTGQTKIVGGVLQADDGVGINRNSNINLAGGVLQTSGTFSRYLGTASDRLQWTGSGGFAAAGGDLTVRLNNGAGLTWGSGSFVPAASSLLFGSSSADSDVYFVNAINLGGGTRTIINNGGADGDNLAVLKGIISNGSLILGDGTTVGTIVMAAANTYSGTTTVMDGTTLRLSGAGTVAQSSDVQIDGTLDISGLTSGASIKTLSGSGDVALGSKTLTVTAGSTTFAGVIGGEGNLVIAGGTQTLSDVNTYTGSTTIDVGATLNLFGSGSIATSSGVEANGVFGIADTTSGATIKALTGSGSVALGTKTLTVSDASGTFSGVIGGSGDVTISGGTQGLSGVNTYTGATNVASGAKLDLTGSGSIATSSGVALGGELDISGKSGDASLISLTGDGTVTLGSNSLNLTGATGQFDGAIGGAGGLNVTGGTANLTGTNTYTGATSISYGATLKLTDDGSIADSSGVEANGTFGISDTTDGASIKTLSGSGNVDLGSKTLTVTAASTTFSGVIGGAGGGLDLTGGELTLTGVNTYSGTTHVAEDATLYLSGIGGIAPSSMSLDGTFDISGTTTGAAIKALTGAGLVSLGNRSLTITAATGTFGGTVDSTGGDFIVGGGTQNVTGATIGTTLVAATGGKIVVDSSTITAGGSKPALAIVNGGTIETTNTSLGAGGATAYADFDQAGGVANFVLGDGTVLTASDGTLLLVTRTGAGSDGIVNFKIDNGGVANGDIIDRDLKTGAGGTDVTISEGASWTGLADTASFLIEAGGSAVFEDGSKIDGSLVAQAGSIVFGSTLGSGLEITGDATIENGAITGNVNIIGDLNLNGLLSPGSSPGVVNVSGSLNNGGYADSLFEIRFGSNNPLPGLNNQYDQLNVGADVNATLPVRLAAWQPGMSPGDKADRSVALGNLEDIELIKVGGDQFTGFEQVGRLTQNGHEVFLVSSTRDADAGLQVANAGKNEVEFFGAGPITVYGVDAFEQDETFGLVTAANTIHMADRDMIGSYLERRGARLEAGQSSTWMRMGASHSDIVDGVTWSQDVAFGQVGIDLLTDNSFHAGVFGTFGNVNSQITTNTGINPMVGQMYAAGVEASWTAGGAYLDAAGQVGWSQFTFTPTAASDMTFTGVTTTASIEAGYAIDLDVITVTPWTQVVWQSTAFGDVQSDWVDNVEFTDPNSATIRGGIRVAAGGDGFSVYGNAGVAYDAYDQKSVVVDGFEMGSGTGGTKAELGAGIEAKVADGVIITTAIKGSYGIETGDVIGYQGSAGIRGNW